MNQGRISPVNTPPPALVKTWYSLLKQNENREAKERGKEMLLQAFGDMPALVDYLKKHKIAQ